MAMSVVKIMFGMILLVICYAQISSATIYSVGDSEGWIPGKDYSFWVNGRVFAIGDVLYFLYEKGHDVAEVTQVEWSQCSAGQPIFYSKNMQTYVPLERSGDHFFISTGPGDCRAGMALKVTVA